ncbi:MAG: RluA family pseudouridine synthase [Flavobacteriales bacterium]|nr:RluA family pseudouridine synthase [Flavobacteriales bacterium]
MSEELEEIEDDELFEHHRVVCDPGQTAIRIDLFLKDRIPNASRNQIQVAAKSGFVKVNTTPVKSNYKVKPMDVVTIELPYPVRELELIPEDIPLDILYEDQHLVVVNKPTEMVVHPGYGNYTGTMVNALIYHFGNLPSMDGQPEPRPGLVHRLDKNTSGVMVVGKTEEAMMKLSEQFYHRTTERKYRALVWGDIEEDGTVTGNLARNLKNRKVMSVFPDGDMGKHAVTHYRVLKRYGYVTLVECQLETGRTHQIRVHMQYINHPLFNDPEYGGDKILKGTTFAKYRQFVENSFRLIPGQALHAFSLGFKHPATDEWMYFEKEIPEGFAQILDRWENYINTRQD